MWSPSARLKGSTAGNARHVSCARRIVPFGVVRHTLALRGLAPTGLSKNTPHTTPSRTSTHFIFRASSTIGVYRSTVNCLVTEFFDRITSLCRLATCICRHCSWNCTVTRAARHNLETWAYFEICLVYNFNFLQPKHFVNWLGALAVPLLNRQWTRALH